MKFVNLENFFSYLLANVCEVGTPCLKNFGAEGLWLARSVPLWKREPKGEALLGLTFAVKCLVFTLEYHWQIMLVSFISVIKMLFRSCSFCSQMLASSRVFLRSQITAASFLHIKETTEPA